MRKPSHFAMFRGLSALAGVVLILVACTNEESLGDHSAQDAGSPNAVSSSKQLVDTTAEEKRVVCDHVASSFGGYGKRAECVVDGGLHTVKGPGPSQAECVSAITETMATTKCFATVEDFESCEAALVTNVCTGAVPTACQPFLAKCPDVDIG